MNTATQTNGSAALAKQGPPAEPVAAMKYWISKSAGAFAKILPKHLTAERFLKVAHAAVTKNPKLAQCEPKDIVMALIQCSEMGLEPNTPLHHVHLIPFKNGMASKRAGRDVFDVQVIVGFEGYLELIYRSGKIKSLSCEVAYETDEFDYDLGSKPFVHHKPNLKIRDVKDRGQLLAAYLCAEIDGGGTKIDLMPYADIIEIRDKSQGYRYAVKDGKDHPWISSFGEMAKKTVVRRGQKQMPKGIEVAAALARAAEIDGRSEYGRRKTIDVDFTVVNELPVELGISSADTRDDDHDARGDDAEEPKVERTPEVTMSKPAATAPQAERLKEQTRAKRGAKATTEKPAEAPASPAEEKPRLAPWEHLKVGAVWADEKGQRHVVVWNDRLGCKMVQVLEATADAPPPDDEPAGREPGDD